MAISDIRLGKNARIKINGTDVARVKSASFTLDADTLDVSSIGEEYKKFITNTKSWKIDLEGTSDKGSAEQVALLNACTASAPVSGFQFWKDETTYIAADTVADVEATVIVTNYSENFQSDALVGFSCTVQGVGPYKVTTS